MSERGGHKPTRVEYALEVCPLKSRVIDEILARLDEKDRCAGKDASLSDADLEKGGR